MRLLIWAYLTIYALLWILAEVVDVVAIEPSERDPLVERVLDRLVIVVSFMGMLFYQTAPAASWLQSVWKAIVVAIILFHVVSNLRTGIALFGADGAYEEKGALAVWGGALYAALLIVPSTFLNILYAFRLE